MTASRPLAKLASGAIPGGSFAVSRIFVSHSSTDNAPAIALRDWLVDEGWNDLFVESRPRAGHCRRRTMGAGAQRGGTPLRGCTVPDQQGVARLALVHERTYPRTTAQQAIVRRADRGGAIG